MYSTVYIPYSSIKGKEIKPTYVVGIITVVSYTHMYTYVRNLRARFHHSRVAHLSLMTWMFPMSRKLNSMLG